MAITEEPNHAATLDFLIANSSIQGAAIEFTTIDRGDKKSKMSSLPCRQCGQSIKFDDKHISQRTGKKIPLDVGTNEPHDCPVRRDQHQQQQGQQQIRYHQCNKGAG